MKKRRKKSNISKAIVIALVIFFPAVATILGIIMFPFHKKKLYTWCRAVLSKKNCLEDKYKIQKT